MAEKRDWNVGLNAKGLEKSVSEEQARHMCTTQGAHSLFIIDAHHGPYLTAEDGSIKMNLIIDSAELIPAEHEARVRTFMRALYLNRPDQYGQSAFEEAKAGEVPIDAAAAGLDAVVEHDGDGNPIGIWDAAVDGPDAEPCAFPGCVLAAEHDGDHNVPEAAAEAAEQNVVAFSGKGK